jgi:hypothetical protein
MHTSLRFTVEKRTIPAQGFRDPAGSLTARTDPLDNHSTMGISDDLMAGARIAVTPPARPHVPPHGYFDEYALAALGLLYQDLPDVRHAIATAATAVRLALDDDTLARVTRGRRARPGSTKCISKPARLQLARDPAPTGRRLDRDRGQLALPLQRPVVERFAGGDEPAFAELAVVRVEHRRLKTCL